MPRKKADTAVMEPEEVTSEGIEEIETSGSGLDLRVAQKTLIGLINLATKAVMSRPSHPVLANLLLTAESDRLSVTGFDLSLGIEASADVQVIQAGRLTVPAKLTKEIVEKLEGEIHLVQMDSDVGSVQLQIRAGKSEFVIQGLSADEFPALPEIDGNSVFELPKGHLVKGISDCQYAVSGDETKQVLTAIHIELISTEPDATKLEFASTDGHRMVRSRVGDGEGDITADNLRFNLPGKSAAEWIAAINNSPKELETATVALGGDSTTTLTVGNFKLWSRLLEGQYPNYSQLIPKQFARTITLNAKEVNSAIARAMVVADQKNNVIVLKADKSSQTLAITVDAQDVGRVREEIQADIDMVDDEFTVAFNGKYLSDALKSCGASLQLFMNTETSPAVVRPVEGGDIVHLIMPVQIRN